MVVEIQRTCRSVRIQNQRIAGSAGDGIAQTAGHALPRLHDRHAGEEVRQVRVQRRSGKERRSTGNGAWGSRSGHEANVDLGKDVVVIVGKVHAKFGLFRREVGAESIAAIVLEIADIEAGIAALENAHGRADCDPAFRFVISANAIVLEMARPNPCKGIVSGEKFGIGADAEVVCGPRRKANQAGMAIDQSSVGVKIIGARCANPLRVHGLAGTGAASGKRGKENQVLTVCNGMSDFAAFKTIADMGSDPPGEVVLYQEGVDPPPLSEKLS